MKRKKSILIVDDDKEFRRALLKTLERSGYSVRGARDGCEALEALSKEHFDLIISDLVMPNMDGVEFMTELKRRKIDSPIIFVTAYGQIESYMDLMNMGAFDYLSKPLSGQDILKVAESAINR